MSNGISVYSRLANTNLEKCCTCVEDWAFGQGDGCRTYPQAAVAAPFDARPPIAHVPFHCHFPSEVSQPSIPLLIAHVRFVLLLPICYFFPLAEPPAPLVSRDVAMPCTVLSIGVC